MPAVALALAALACAPPAMLLRDFRVVCVSPSTPGNIGMIARAIANFEAGGLTIVAPDYDRADADCISFERRLATQSAGLRVLDEARVCSSLAEAVHGCDAVVGFTRRRGVVRSASSVDISVGQLASLAPFGDNRGSGGSRAAAASSGGSGAPSPSSQAAEAGQATAPGAAVALVFGREADGLRTSELLLCGFTCEIPTSAQHGSLNLAQAATFALGRIFEEAYSATTLPAAGAHPTPNDDPAYMAASAAPQTGGRGAEAGAVAGAYPLGADLTSRRAPLLRPIARVGAPYADASGSYTGDADAPGAWGGHLAAGARPQSLPSLRPASASELDALVRRAISVVYRSPKEAAGASPDAPIGASDGASGGPGGSPSRVVSVRAPEDLPVRDMPGEAAPLPGLGSDWVRTSRGSRPATADQRTAAVLRRILQRSQLTGKELRALHAALRQAERHINGGEYFNG